MRQNIQEHLQALLDEYDAQRLAALTAGLRDMFDVWTHACEALIEAARKGGIGLEWREDYVAEDKG